MKKMTNSAKIYKALSPNMSIYRVEMPNITPNTYGDITIKYDSGSYHLYNRGTQWMGTDENFVHAKDTLYSQYDLAYGDVLLTGLGFGILTKALSEKPEITSVTVLEISKDVIDAFLLNNTLNDKVTIILADACTYSSEVKYDCLFPDHYELQSSEWMIKDMNNLSRRIKHDVFWPWNIEQIFLQKTYPRMAYQKSTIARYFFEMPEKWRAFILENFPDSPSLAELEDETIVNYISKYIKYFYK
jgi:hypothetical protein